MSGTSNSLSTSMDIGEGNKGMIEVRLKTG